MNTEQIEAALKSNKYTKRIFHGVYSVDRLPELSLNVPVACVVNLDGSDKPGSHWVGVYKDSTNESSEYFDSFGNPPPNESQAWRIQRFLGLTYKYNNELIQQPLTTTCGQHVIYYIFHKSKGRNLQDIINSYPNSLDNDIYVNNFVESNFKINPYLIDFKFLWSQWRKRKKNKKKRRLMS